MIRVKPLAGTILAAYTNTPLKKAFGVPPAIVELLPKSKLSTNIRFK
jgi:hypothetical protein